MHFYKVSPLHTFIIKGLSGTASIFIIKVSIIKDQASIICPLLTSTYIIFNLDILLITSDRKTMMLEECKHTFEVHEGLLSKFGTTTKMVMNHFRSRKINHGNMLFPSTKT